ncbi:MAG: alkane 1-monooxygenase [Glaciecola sp.]|jgi:alkane 1-monooxygenase|uniref:alkane 1-monooxygenase n=1 Tax=Congregibacter sp. TaxID=2744308 RepID=UPI0039E683D4
MSLQALSADGQTITYTDRRRWLWSLSLFWPLMPAISCWLAASSGQMVWFWGTLIVWYCLVPVVDHLLPTDKSNPPEEVVPQLEADRYYRVLTYLTVPIHYFTLIYTAYVVGTQNLPWHAVLGLALSVGVVNGLAINTGHELGHKKTTTERWLAKIVLAVVGYGHFLIEHNRGHHVDVATPIDPASAKMGQSIYGFATGEIPNAVRRAWTSEKNRLARQGRGGPWTLQNEVLQPTLMTIVLYGSLLLAFGWIMVPYLFLQALWGWFGILTSANYVEHYGLLRKKLENGRYEQCQPHHSWNSNHIMSNLILFNLQRHSDHHANATRRYQSLRSFDDLPELPSGYPLMFAIALIPPLWFALMDKRVMAWSDGDLAKLNVLPSKKERLMAQFASGYNPSA